MTHFDHLTRHIPDLDKKYILDLGSGEGAFAVDAASHGARVVGLDYYEGHIKISNDLAKERGVDATFIIGKGEQLPFPDESFDFINMSEVLEHVEDPAKVLGESRRVLKSGGNMYLSAPNRLGLYDPHFHIHFLNWLPRSWSEKVIGMLGKHKDYASAVKGMERLSDMHYFTYKQLLALLKDKGLNGRDIRLERLNSIQPSLLRLLAKGLYYPCRFCYFNTFHILVTG